MDGRQFDGLTRSLASGISRRSALGALAGGLVTALGLKNRTSAQGNSDCAHFCNSVFAPGPDRGTCKSSAAQGIPGNVCEACGADPARYCGGSCVDLQTDVNNCGVCGNACTTDLENADAVCDGGVCGYICRDNCGDGFAQDPGTCACYCALTQGDCPERYLLDSSSCSCNAPTCAADAEYFSACGAGCFCEITTEGLNVCFDLDNWSGCEAEACNSSADCAPGEACAASPFSGCPEPHCHTLCNNF